MKWKWGNKFGHSGHRCGHGRHGRDLNSRVMMQENTRQIYEMAQVLRVAKAKYLVRCFDVKAPPTGHFPDEKDFWRTNRNWIQAFTSDTRWNPMEVPQETSAQASAMVGIDLKLKLHSQ